MKKLFRMKFLAMTLAFSMVLSSLPVSVFAEDNVSVQNENELNNSIEQDDEDENETDDIAEDENETNDIAEDEVLEDDTDDGDAEEDNLTQIKRSNAVLDSTPVDVADEYELRDALETADIIKITNPIILTDDLTITEDITFTGFIGDKTSATGVTMIYLGNYNLTIAEDATVTMTGNTAKHLLRSNGENDGKLILQEKGTLIIEENNTSGTMYNIPITLNDAELTITGNTGLGINTGFLTADNESIVTITECTGGHGFTGYIELNSGSEMTVSHNAYAGINAYGITVDGGSTLTAKYNGDGSYPSTGSSIIADLVLMPSDSNLPEEDIKIVDGSISIESLSISDNRTKKEIKIDTDGVMTVGDTVINENTSFIAIETDLRTAASAGGTYIITKPIVLTDNLTITEDITFTGFVGDKTSATGVTMISLGSNNLTVAEDKIVTITNNTAKHLLKSNGKTSGTLILKEGAELIIENNNTSGTMYNIPIKLDNAELTITGNTGLGINTGFITADASKISITGSIGGHGFTGYIELNSGSEMTVSHNAYAGINAYGITVDGGSTLTAKYNGDGSYPSTGSSIIADLVLMPSDSNLPEEDIKIVDGSISIESLSISDNRTNKEIEIDTDGVMTVGDTVINENTSFIAAETDLRTAASAGGTYIITKPIVLTDNLTITEDITFTGFVGDKTSATGVTMISLGSNNLTVAEDKIVTITNNTAKHLLKSNGKTSGTLILKEGAELIIENNNTSGTMYNIPIKLDNAELTITGNTGLGINTGFITADASKISITGSIGGHGFTGYIELNSGSEMTVSHNAYAGINAYGITVDGGSTLTAKYNGDGSYPSTGSSIIADIVLMAQGNSDLEEKDISIDGGTVTAGSINTSTDRAHKTIKIINNGTLILDNKSYTNTIEDISPLAITVNLNGGNTMNIVNSLGKTESVANNASVTVTYGYKLPDPSRSGYTFINWTLNGSAVENVTTAGTYVANWKEVVGPVDPDPTPDPEPPSSSGGGGGGRSYTSASTKPAVTINDSSMGTVLISKDNKTVTITPKEGYVISDVIINGTSMGAITSYTFDKASSKHTVEAIFQKEEKTNSATSDYYKAPENKPSTPFSDVSASDWYFEAVKYAYTNGIFSGTSDTTFGPSDNMTRAMFATVMHRLAGTPAPAASSVFTDIPAGTWYSAGIAWSNENGIVNGVGDNLFAPNNNITREQMAVMLYNYAQATGYDVLDTTGLDSFVDASEVSPWAESAVKWAVANGLLSGKGNNDLDPSGSATRAEVASILMRFNQKY